MKKITLLFVVIFAALSAMAQTTYPIVYSFGENAKFKTWDSSYSLRTLDYPEAVVTFEGANKQPSGNSIDDIPVTKGKYVQVVLKDTSKTITAVKLVARQWTTKAQTITLNAGSAEGSLTATSFKSSNFLLEATTMPENTKVVRFTFSSSSNQIGIESISLVLGGATEVAVEAPQLSVAGGVKEEAFNLEMTCPTAGADIYYTLNGGAETKYTAAINIAATTTVKAWAVKGEDKSAEVTATYTFVEYVKNATISQVLAAEVSEYVWYEMTGVIDSLYNTTYGNFNLVNGTEKILVYGLTATKKTSNDKSFASLGLKEGDKITIWGTRSEFKGAAQVGGPAYFVEKVVEPTITATWDIEEGDTVADFTSATLTFTGVESAKAKSTYSNYFFYKVAEDGTATLVPSACSDGYMDAAASGTAVTFSIDKETCYLDMPQYGAMFGLTTGKYRIAVPVGAIQFNGDASNLNTEEYVLNFTYVAPKAPTQVETAYTVNPENNSTIAEIREVVINFTEYETIKVAEPDLATGANIPTVSTYMEDYGMSMPASYMMFKADSLSANGLRLYVDPRYTGGMEAFATEGLYTISIPAGVVSFGSDSINQTITLTYTVGQVEEELPMEVEFENIAAIYEMGMWDMAYYESYSNYEVKAILKSQPTVVDKVVTSGMMGGSMNNYYLNDGTGVIVLQAEGDRIEPILDENWEQIGNDTIPGLNIEIGKKLPANFFATIDFKTVTDDETYLPTGEVYGAPVMAYVPRETGDTIVDEYGWETIVTESNEDFAARCEASDFVEEAVEVSIDDLLANRIDYAGKLVVVDTTASYYAETMMDYFSGVEKTTAYMYCGESSESFEVESYEEECTTYVYVYPKYTEDNNNFAGTLFNLAGGEFTAAALDANVTIDLAKARFDWNSIAQGQTMIVKEYQIVTPGPGQDVDNSELVVNIYSNNGSVYVETEAGAMIEVYTVNGLRVYAGVSNTNTTVINGLNTNIAIIRVNGEAYKVMVK